MYPLSNDRRVIVILFGDALKATSPTLGTSQGMTFRSAWTAGRPEDLADVQALQGMWLRKGATTQAATNLCIQCIYVRKYVYVCKYVCMSCMHTCVHLYLCICKTCYETTYQVEA